MLLKLTAEQISEYWNLLKPAITRSLPPITAYTEGGLNEIFKQLLSDDMQAWALVKETDEQVFIQAIMTTVLSSDIGTGIYNLLIYTMFSFVPLNEDMYVDILNTLRKYAKEHNCVKLIAYSNVQRIIDVTTRVFGAKSDFKLLTLEV